MAFNLFKKKEVQYPADEKAEVLGPELPEVSDLPPLPEGEEQDMGMQPEEGGGFGEMTPEAFGFRAPEEMMPPQQQMRAPPAMQQSMEPVMFQPMRPVAKQSPHIYIRVSKYKDVMDAINDLGQKIQETKNDIEEIHEMEGNEADKLREAAEVILKIEELLKYLESTFKSPEE